MISTYKNNYKTSKNKFFNETKKIVTLIDVFIKKKMGCRQELRRRRDMATIHHG